MCLLALLVCAPLAHAQVYRCIGAQGEPVFSGEPCGMPAPAANATGQVTSFAGVCAQSPQALRSEVATAFTRHDVNRLAGLILWQGMDQASARATLRSFHDWLQQPLLGIAIAYATGPPIGDYGQVPRYDARQAASALDIPPPAPIGFEISTANDTRTFGIAAFGGCWWLTF